MLKGMRKKVTLILSLIAFMFSTNLFAQELKDISGAKDNPLISRFKGSSIQFCKTIKWDTYILPYSKHSVMLNSSSSMKLT